MFLQTINFVKISSRLGMKKGTSKTKAIQADLGIFTHTLDTFRNNQAYSGVIEAYSDIIRTLRNQLC